VDEYRSVCAAITALVKEPARAESISTPNGGSRSVTYANLGELVALRDSLARQLAAAGRKASGRGSMGYPSYV
jgi:hypothetical protein